MRLPRGAAWMSISLSSGIVRIGEPELALAAAEEGLEDPQEVALDGGEGLDEHGAGGAVDLPDRLDQRLARAHQVVPLGW